MTDQRNRHSPDPTLAYYAAHAQEFADSTVGVEFSHTQHKFEELLPPGARILDFGCGSGRDTKHFLEAGYDVVAIDGSPELCQYAHELTGIPHPKRAVPGPCRRRGIRRNLGVLVHTPPSQGGAPRRPCAHGSGAQAPRHYLHLVQARWLRWHAQRPLLLRLHGAGAARPHRLDPAARLIIPT
ncbi:MAG: class I SAM-dependent methyltransferase [Atopobiaceae bacterium]|nr:class I SAM-dependent methyltransferase [Atopobiaceae bacterium]